MINLEEIFNRANILDLSFFNFRNAITACYFADRDVRRSRYSLFSSVQCRTASAQTELVASGAALDVHTHIASQFLTDHFTGGGTPAVGAEDLVARLDEANVARAIILSAGYFGEGGGLPDDTNMVPRTTSWQPKSQSIPTG